MSVEPGGSAPERIRTSDLRFRRPTLYPAELRARAEASVGGSRGAERAGFEPAMEREPHTRLAGECLQPLGHLSGLGGASVNPGRSPTAEREMMRTMSISTEHTARGTL